MTEKEKLSLEIRKFVESIDKNIRTKLENVNAKAKQYDVPTELWQKRCPRTNRVLIPWKVIKQNNISYEQLQSYENGITINFINEDYFNENGELFNILKNKIGSDEKISAIISICNESGDSSSNFERECFEKLLNNTCINYKGETIYLNKDNYKNYIIHRKKVVGRYTHSGNENWEGFLFISIQGGQQNSIKSYDNANSYPQIFNPAIEYLNNDCANDLIIGLGYLILKSINIIDFENKENLIALINKTENILRTIEYDNELYCGNLYDYYNNHESLTLTNSGKLIDPICIKEINCYNFSDKYEDENYTIQFSHNIPVSSNKIIWDNKKQCLLSPSQAPNTFWSFKISNMMQQDKSLDKYWEDIEKAVEKRKNIKNQD